MKQKVKKDDSLCVKKGRHTKCEKESGIFTMVDMKEDSALLKPKPMVLRLAAPQGRGSCGSPNV